MCVISIIVLFIMLLLHLNLQMFNLKKMNFSCFVCMNSSATNKQKTG